MRESPEKPIFGPETPALDPQHPPRIKAWRSVAKAISWRTVGTIDTFLVSYLLITYLGPTFGHVSNGSEAETAGYIAITEVVTKMVLYFLHERGWAKIGWGVFNRNGRRREQKRRTTAKTISWRTIASTDTVLLAWFFTGNFRTALSIGGLEIFSKLILYYLHERIWSALPFGIEAQTPKGPRPESPLAEKPQP